MLRMNNGVYKVLHSREVNENVLVEWLICGLVYWNPSEVDLATQNLPDVFYLVRDCKDYTLW